MTEIPSYLQPMVIITALGLMLRFMVVNELRRINAGIKSHGRRIRKQEILTASLQSALMAKGCLSGEGCPLTEGDDDEDDDDS